ncbi:MAG TPA: isocitrate lyase/phosphoenolpyruvate mutase family protein [Gaiellaceae bacterium]
MDTAEKAELLRSMHRPPPLLVLPNAWDVASARTFAELPACRALATTSAGVARSLGFEDGEQAPADEMIRAAGRIAAAVEVPVTGDLERGYGDPAGTAGAAWEAGVCGMNFEDSTGGAMVAVAEQAAAIAGIRDAVPRLVLNARVDVFLRSAGGVDEAVERGNAYLEAGADCVYPILCPAEAIGELARRIDGPVNVVVAPGVPPPAELERLGVARLTFGGGLAALAYAEAARIATEALGGDA